MEKTVSESRTEQVQILTQGTLNGDKRLFGGKLMEWIDVVAAVVARRHSGYNVTTAVVDTLQFRRAAYSNDTIVLNGYITYVGRTSMEVCVKTYVENLSGEKSLINTAYIVMVALDENENPTVVPALKLETYEEKLEWEAAIKRNNLRKTRRRENY
ncbi:MAG: acyl-CoA thioesterase [Eubacteriales bacterium]|nr:acyl-CoA thioesterase [Eubacteriales bacterium]MDD4422676.1 acyl-CoA thioesterase [Eubacteriales bacterium]HBR32801.1 acyl-CoA thioesterase [Clostridiales bacterium]